MLSSTSLKELDLRFDELIKKEGTEELNLLTVEVSMSPTLRKGAELNFFRFRGSLTLREKLFLGIIFWYIPDEIRVLAQIELERIWGGERREWLAVLNTSKVTALGLLLVQDELGDNDVWGNYLKEKFFKRLFSKFPKKLWYLRKKARPLVRRRGHRDSTGGREYHGPNRLDFNKVITEEEYLLKEEELDRKIHDLRKIIENRLASEFTKKSS